MSLINQLLELHPLSPGSPYLWTMKLTSSEYSTLKDYIRENISHRSFSCVRKESALFYAEWWRREFNGGQATKKDVCISVFGNDELENQFFQAASEGARMMNLQLIRTRGEQRESTQTMYSLLYQGGLPMNFIVNEIVRNGARNNWNRFFRRLVWNDLDYDNIPGNRIASQSDSIREFCDALRRANNISEAPFNMEGGLHWWRIVERDFIIERKEYVARNPFRFKWLIELNENRRTAEVSFLLTGPQKLSDEFVTEHRLTELNLLSLSVHINGAPYPLAEYYKNDEVFYSRRSVDRCFRYNMEDSVELVLNEGLESCMVLERKALDFSDPKILTLDDRTRNVYTLGDVKNLAVMDCLIACTEDWQCEGFNPITYQFNSDNILFFKITPDTIPVTMFSESGEIKKLDPTRPLASTILDEQFALSLAIPTKERLFNAPDGVVFYDDRKRRADPQSVLYAAKGSREWREDPGVGLIRAKIKRDDNESVDPVQFINVGTLDVTCPESSRDSCTLQITWPHGRITCDLAQEVEQNTWLISRNHLVNAQFAPFTFIPRRNGEPFTVNFLIPFYGFQIYDYNGNKVPNRAVIPISDLDGFRYYIRPESIIEITPSAAGGQRRDSLKYKYSEENGNAVKISERIADLPPRTKEIPFEGRLSSLFMDGNKQLMDLMDKQTSQLPDASVNVRVENEGEPLFFYFQDFPYHQREGEESVILENRRGLPNYTGGLMALPFDDPQLTPIPLTRQDDNPDCFTIPNDILESDYRSWLVFGNIKGYVLPRAFNLPEDDETKQKPSRSELLSNLKSEMKEAPLFSPVWKRALAWFDNIQRWMIPGSSVLELVALADDSELLGKFLLHLFLFHCKDEEELENIKPALLEFQRQLYFLWNWARIRIEDTEKWLDESWSVISPLILRTYTDWVLSNHDDSEWMDFLQITDGHVNEYRDYLIEQYHLWLKGLFTISPPKKEYEYVDLNQNGGDETLSEEAQQVFACIRNEMTQANMNVGNMTQNELWKKERLFLAQKLSQYMNLGDLGESERVKTEIKKTIIYGLKFKLNDEI